VIRHESIVVVYDSCQAIAEEIADKLGAETISVQSMNTRHIGNSQSFVLAVEFQADGQLTPHWQYARQTFYSASLSGKNFAVFVALGNRQDHSAAAEMFCGELKKNGAHIVGELSYVGSA
jgi:flavodoxin